MRYFQEYRHKFSGASGVAIDAGKKLLGYLANQKRLSGVDSLVQRIAVKDESGAVWTVEARFDKSIPSVLIFPPGSGEAACEMYVESGLLDLGPNIASDASERFNRGLPEFAEGPATLYFGDGVECLDGVGGFNGAVGVFSGGLSSECLPSRGNALESRLTDPVKKQAQAVLPASCWSGLMQRYVQAVYGGDTLEYSATADTLTIGGAAIPVASSIGLLNFGGTLRFIAIADGVLTLHAVQASSPCVQAVLRSWQAMADDNPLKSKVLTVALSGCTIGEVVGTGTISATGNHHFSSRAAWVFAHDAPTAVAVLEQDGVATVYEATFSIDGTTVVAEVETLASGNVLNAGEWTLLVADQSPYGSPAAHASGFAESATPLQAGDNYDFPVYATYQDGEALVVSCSLVASSAPIADASLCFDRETPYGPIIIGEDDSKRCRSDLVDVAQVAYGFHATGWSTVALSDCFLSDTGEVVRSLPAGFQGVSISDTPGQDSYSGDGDFQNRVPIQALSGPIASGFDSCAISNSDAGTATTIDDNVPESEPCVVSYIFDAGEADGFCEMTRPYYPAAGVIFDGKAYGAGLQVLSLAWGATTCLVSDRYAFNGGRGGYLSFGGAAYLLFQGGDRVHDFAKLTVNGTLNTYTTNIPGDCSSGSTLTSSEPFTFVETRTLPPAEGDLVRGLWGFASPTIDSDVIVVDVLQPADNPDEGSLIVYPDPRARGLESISCSVFMGAHTNDETEENAVSVYLPDSEYEHPSGPGTFIANDDTEGDCDAYQYLGLQELVDAHHVGDLAEGDDKDFVLQDPSSPSWLVEGFAYQAAQSLLGACVVPTASIDRGASLNMDRQTITGGYSPVSTPSFVGWA